MTKLKALFAAVKAAALKAWPQSLSILLAYAIHLFYAWIISVALALEAGVHLPIFPLSWLSYFGFGLGKHFVSELAAARHTAKLGAEQQFQAVQAAELMKHMGGLEGLFANAAKEAAGTGAYL